jgi:hypothetical protein
MLNVIPMKGILNFGILISFVKAWSKPIECCDAVLSWRVHLEVLATNLVVLGVYDFDYNVSLWQ